MQKTQDISIIHISLSSRHDRSCYYLLDIDFMINKKRFRHSDYLDPCTNKIIPHVVQPNVNIAGNRRVQILTELAIKLSITGTDALALFHQIIQQVNHIIDHLPEYRTQFPNFMELLAFAIKQGFRLLAITPEFHLMQTISTPKEDVELHICTSSILEFIDELNSFATKDGVSESYSYRELVQKCMWQSAFFVSVNQAGNGWNLHCVGDKMWEHKSRRCHTLRDLYYAILDCKQSMSALVT